MDNVPKIEDVISVKPEIDSLQYIDKGGFKVVFKGDISGKEEAIKLIYLPSGDEEFEKRTEITARVKREFDALQQCKTDHLVKLGTMPLELITIKDIDYLIYSEEFIHGESLKARVQNNYLPDFNELKRLTTCLMESLVELNNLNLIHRDIKPGNVMATRDFGRSFVLLDLGIAFKIRGTDLTVRGGGPIGTLRYIAPELFRPDYKDVLDIRSDIYSAGVTIFKYASGFHPLLRADENIGSTIYRILKMQPDKLFSRRSDIPEQFCKMIDRCIKKMPALRFSNPKAV
ncbi:MAG: serine/threonine protein kinase [Candidatus Brocadiaceae bacterium]|nr:serine/threonine protein kinase [Candidatus Brocadiaceae bacterium]